MSADAAASLRGVRDGAEGQGGFFGLDRCYEVRSLAHDDFRKGYCSLLAQLTDVGDLSEEVFAEVFELRQQQAGTYVTVVVENLESQQVVGTATLIIERKFVHGGACVGHVEDVVTDLLHRGKGIARAMVKTLELEAQKRSCYKNILDCKESNCGLYGKCGYRVCETQMRVDLPSAPH